jgi:hypothetical protein
MIRSARGFVKLKLAGLAVLKSSNTEGTEDTGQGLHRRVRGERPQRTQKRFRAERKQETLPRVNRTALQARSQELRASLQRCDLSLRFLRGDEIGVGILPDF